MMQRWLSRFSFTFIIVGFYLAYEAYRALNGQVAGAPGWRTIVYLLAAAASLSLGFLGIRERHRRDGP